jgi:nitrate reductase assembly molybdenum cofactor insertion protein NarJ
MTTVIDATAVRTYRRDVAARDELQLVAAALERPRAGYMKRVQAARDAVAPYAGEAARQLVVFGDRLADLSTEELGELYDETFRRDPSTRIEPLVARLTRRPADVAEAQDALRELTPLLERLDADRNPFAYVVRALCCRLLARVSPLQRT